jgi:hypothetical protein
MLIAALGATACSFYAVDEYGIGGLEMDRHEIRPAAWKMALAVVGMLASVPLGTAMVMSSSSVVEKAAGVLAVVFFGGFGGYALYMRSKGQGRLAILPTGLEISMFGPVPRVIPWTDIDAIGVLQIAKQEFTTIRLRSYRALVDALTDEEARRAVKLFGRLQMLSYATIAVGAANLEDVSDLAHFASGSAKVKSVIAILQQARSKYGAELLLGWNMRDRSAGEFAEYLEEHRRKHG